MEMESTRITSTDHPDWEGIWKVYEISFPQNERRTLDAQKTILTHPKYHFQILREEGDVIGLIAWWGLERFRYLEHFAVVPSKRSGGFGSRILSHWMQQPGPVILLEIDPLVDEISRRRHGFYMRLGYLDNPGISHSHPSYFDGTGEVPLLVLSYPREVERDVYEEFYTIQRKEMLAHFHKEFAPKNP